MNANTYSTTQSHYKEDTQGSVASRALHKSHILFHKNGSLCDFYIMTLLLRILHYLLLLRKIKVCQVFQTPVHFLRDVRGSDLSVN